MSRSVLGIALTAAGTLCFGYAVYLEMTRARRLSWWDRSLLLGTAGVVAILVGVVVADP